MTVQGVPCDRDICYDENWPAKTCVKIVSSMLAGRIFGIKTLVLVQIAASNSERKQYVDGWPCDPLTFSRQLE